MTRRDTRHTILQAGLHLARTRGYHDTGINDILTAASVPKGSFYHYFSSKEDFGRQLVEHYNVGALQLFEAHLHNTALPPRERLRTLFATVGLQLEREGGCLLGSFSQEMGSVSDTLAAACTEALRAQQQLVVGCIREGQELGDIASDLDASALGELLLNSWQGVLMRMKTTRSRAPLDNFLALYFGRFLLP